MSHFEQKKFVNIVVDELKKNNNFNNFSVLDVGSYDVGGSIRDLFNKNNYTGVDIIEGPNVDLVINGSQLDKLNKKYDIVISCECFEHAENWNDIFLSMYDVCKDDGFGSTRMEGESDMELLGRVMVCSIPNRTEECPPLPCNPDRFFPEAMFPTVGQRYAGTILAHRLRACGMVLPQDTFGRIIDLAKH